MRLLLSSLISLLLFANNVYAAITDGKFTTAQTWDVQWYISSGTLHASTFNNLYVSVNYTTQTSSAHRLTDTQQADLSSNGRYLQFFESTTNSGTYGLASYNSDGSLYKVLHNTGSFRALADGAIFYNGNNMWGTLITTEEGYYKYDSDSFTVETSYPTNTQLANYTYDNTEPLGSGETSAPSYSSDPTSQQLQDRTNARAVTGSGIYIQQSGDNLDLDINQAGEDQLIAGTSSTSSGLVDASVVGDYNTVNVKQGHEFGISTDNVLLFGINGNHNSLTVEQGNTSTDEGGHRAVVDVTGGYNTIELYQYDGGLTGDHFAKIVIGGDDNSVTSHQRDNGDKMLFLNITGDDNSITTDQKGTGEHFLDITAGSDQTISVTQENSGSHSATINMSGYSSGLTLNQNSTTDQTYSLDQTCLNANGCGTTTLLQQ